MLWSLIQTGKFKCFGATFCALQFPTSHVFMPRVYSTDSMYKRTHNQYTPDERCVSYAPSLSQPIRPHTHNINSHTHTPFVPPVPCPLCPFTFTAGTTCSCCSVPLPAVVWQGGITLAFASTTALLLCSGTMPCAVLHTCTQPLSQTVARCTP